MIESIYVHIGHVHDHIPEQVWEKMGAEMSEKYDCDFLLKTVDQYDTKLRVNGDLTVDEMVDVQFDFSEYISAYIAP